LPSALTAAAQLIVIDIRRSPRVSKLPLALLRSLYHRLIFFSNVCSEYPVTETIDSVVFTEHTDYQKERAAKHPLFTVSQFSLKWFLFLYGYRTVLTALPGNS
jgi:hypothetical protein